MSPKTAPASKQTKAPKRVEKAAPAPAKKAAKSAKHEIPVILGAEMSSGQGSEPAVDIEEIEDQEAERAATTGGGNAAALAAAANGSTEMSASFKNFRHHPDMENFYRFIYENDLRHEALTIIDQIQVEKLTRRAIKTAKATAH